MSYGAPEMTEYDGDIYRDAHPECIECGKAGCIAAECPRIDSCLETVLVEHEGEYMHAGCVAAFDRHVENKEAA